jgi:hypothetical protein
MSSRLPSSSRQSLPTQPGVEAVVLARSRTLSDGLGSVGVHHLICVVSFLASLFVFLFRLLYCLFLALLSFVIPSLCRPRRPRRGCRVRVENW